MNSSVTLKALMLTVATLLFGLIGSCVGFVWGLSCGPREADAALWALCWTAIGSLQGACVAPAWYLGQSHRGELRGWSAFLLSSGCGTTSILSLGLWHTLGKDPHLSLVLGVGLLFMCMTPLVAYLFARRELHPGMPVSL